jgi:hypothetical protein
VLASRRPRGWPSQDERARLRARERVPVPRPIDLSHERKP